MSKPSNHIPAILMPSPVLITESAEEFNRFCDALKDDLKVPGTIDHLLITDIAELAWEIRRYRRVKTSSYQFRHTAGLKKSPHADRPKAACRKPETKKEDRTKIGRSYPQLQF